MPKSNIAATMPPAPGVFRLVGGAAMHAVVSGRDGPAIVLESGAGGGVLGWQTVVDGLGSKGTVVTRDRPGFGWSAYIRRDRTAIGAALDLRELLQALAVKPPYVLVGHSLGGLHVRAFASLFPAEVTGLVLVDPSHEHLFDGQPALVASVQMFRWLISMRPILGKKIVRQLYNRAVLNGETPPGVHRILEIFAEIDEAGGPWFDAIKDEYQVATTIGPELRELLSMPLPRRLPVRILSQGRPGPNRRANEFAQRMRDLHRQMITLSDESKHVIAERSGHLIHLDQPELVVQAVQEVLSCARARGLPAYL